VPSFITSSSVPVVRPLCIVYNACLGLLWIYKIQQRDHVTAQGSIPTNICFSCEVLGFIFWQWDRNGTQEEIPILVTKSFSS